MRCLRISHARARAHAAYGPAVMSHTCCVPPYPCARDGGNACAVSILFYFLCVRARMVLVWPDQLPRARAQSAGGYLVGAAVASIHGTARNRQSWVACTHVLAVQYRRLSTGAGGAHSSLERPRARAQGMSDHAMNFTIAGTGAVVDGAVVRHGPSWTDDGLAWALFGMPIAAMLSPSGDAWIELVLVGGDGFVALLVAPETMNSDSGAWEGAHGVKCYATDGWVRADGRTVRDSTDGWGARMAVGESVRIVYLEATRMVSVMWRGAPIDLVALPAAHSIAVTRFGVDLDRGNAVRITGSSAGTRRARCAVVVRRALPCSACACACVFRHVSIYMLMLFDL